VRARVVKRIEALNIDVDDVPELNPVVRQRPGGDVIDEVIRGSSASVRAEVDTSAKAAS